MSRDEAKELVTILMESSLYLTLPVGERHSLIRQLAAGHPALFSQREEECEIGYEASWSGVIDSR